MANPHSLNSPCGLCMTPHKKYPICWMFVFIQNISMTYRVVSTLNCALSRHKFPNSLNPKTEIDPLCYTHRKKGIFLACEKTKFRPNVLSCELSPLESLRTAVHEICIVFGILWYQNFLFSMFRCFFLRFPPLGKKYVGKRW